MARTLGLSVVLVLLGLLADPAWGQAQKPKPKAPDSDSGAMRINIMGPASDMIRILQFISTGIQINVGPNKTDQKGRI